MKASITPSLLGGIQRELLLYYLHTNVSSPSLSTSRRTPGLTAIGSATAVGALEAVYVPLRHAAPLGNLRPSCFALAGW